MKNEQRIFSKLRTELKSYLDNRDHHSSCHEVKRTAVDDEGKSAVATLRVNGWTVIVPSWAVRVDVPVAAGDRHVDRAVGIR